MSEKRDVILTIVQGTDFDYVAPFIFSLQRSGFRGRLIVFASAMKGDAIRQMESHGVTVVSYPFKSKRLREAIFWPLWPLWRRYFAAGNISPRKEKLAHAALPLFYRRHLVYLEYLRAHQDEFDRVFLSDARDVYFQADPFAWPFTAGLHFFMLPATNNIVTARLFVNWEQNQFGVTQAEPHLKKNVSCAGTTFGDTASILNYLSQMVSVSLRARKLRRVTGGDDQGVHNFLICENKFPRATLHHNFAGPILTTAEPLTMNDIRLDSGDRVVDEQGNVIPVLHQYDRIPELKKHILAMHAKGQ